MVALYFIQPLFPQLASCNPCSLLTSKITFNLNLYGEFCFEGSKLQLLCAFASCYLLLPKSVGFWSWPSERTWNTTGNRNFVLTKLFVSELKFRSGSLQLIKYEKWPKSAIGPVFSLLNPIYLTLHFQLSVLCRFLALTIKSKNKSGRKTCPDQLTMES